MEAEYLYPLLNGSCALYEGVTSNVDAGKKQIAPILTM